jgi:hypothetical protein
MLQNRVSEKSTSAYNRLLEYYIIDLFTNLSPESRSKQIPFYVCLIAGQQSQCEVYAKLLIQVNDDTAMKQYHQQNFSYFSE